VDWRAARGKAGRRGLGSGAEKASDEAGQAIGGRVPSRLGASMEKGNMGLNYCQGTVPDAYHSN